MARLDGKAVLITGAASSIGRATATLLPGEGATVALAEINETLAGTTLHKPSKVPYSIASTSQTGPIGVE